MMCTFLALRSPPFTARASHSLVRYMKTNPWRTQHEIPIRNLPIGTLGSATYCVITVDAIGLFK